MSWTPAVPVPAATILLVTADGRVLVGERAGVPFLSGFVAFPGGRLEKGETWRQAALRELAEETGVHLPETTELQVAGRWITPESAPLRFDTTFFLARCDRAHELAPSSELAWARFMRPAEVLDAWRRFEVLLSPPTKHALEVLALGLDDAARRLSAIPEARGELAEEFEPVPGIRALPLRTPTLPPARHTNAYIIGDEQLIVVDPATYDLDERDKLLERLELHLHQGRKLQAVVLTHHHADHTGAAMWLKEELGAPIWAHRITAGLLGKAVEVDRALEEGERITVGHNFELEVLHTPGHAPGHIVLVDKRPGARSMIVGDMVAGIGTIIIDPPEGDMAIYLDQLRRLRALPKAILFPAHGHPLVDGHAKLDEYLSHRLMREAKVFSALQLADRPVKPSDLLERAYDDTPPTLFPLAARSCLAHLEKLVKDGRAKKDGGRFSAL